MKRNQQGFTTTEILLVLVLVGMIGFIGFYVGMQRKNTASVSKTANPSATDTNTGGPKVNQVVTTKIKLVTGQYIPSDVVVKKGSTVSWEISDVSDNTYAIESNTDSTEKFQSSDLKPSATFTHTFNAVGVYGWHDKYFGNLRGTVTVTD